MLPQHYRYDPVTCSYQPVRTNRLALVYGVLKAAGLSIVFGVGLLAGYRYFYPGLEELALRRENEELHATWKELDQRISQSQERLSQVEQEDDNHYRVLLNMEKLPENIRNGGSGGQYDKNAEDLNRHDFSRQTASALARLRNRIRMQSTSFVAVEKKIAGTENMLESRPAMQPLDNRQITNFNDTYGMRKHPIFSDWRFHHGLDLSANIGTPVYATGDGVVTRAEYGGGYGNVVFVNHGFGFETRYAHLSKFKVHEGQKVKRGEVIGYVGNTGWSTRPHLHYEVLYRGEWTNPMNFMYRDLSQKAFNEIVREAKKN